MTRAQQNLQLAATQVEMVSKQPVAVRQIYGGLCHQFPVLVLSCGLCQAVAFSVDKATQTTDPESERQAAHRLLLESMAKLLGMPDAQLAQAAHPTHGLLGMIRTMGTAEYIRASRRVLEAAIYYKRFAVSLLKVTNANGLNEGLNDGPSNGD